MNSWPLLLRRKLEQRVELLEKAESSNEAKANLLTVASRDVVFYVNQFCWTFDPRPESKPNHFPFITYDYQDDYLRALEAAYQGQHDLRTDKSRDMGVTWLVLAWMHYHWRFDESFKALIGSEKEDKADNFQEDSLFGKLDYLCRHMPQWALPKGFSISENRSFLRLVNPEKNNSILGDSANQNFSRQGRYSTIFLDEFAFWQYADSVWTATADATPVRIVVSTPHGKSNKFADLKFVTPIKNVTLHWTKHPLKSQEWYEGEKARRTPREVAQELDIDYEASGGERVFALMANKTLRDHVVIEPFTVPKTWAFRGGLDYGTRNYSSFHVYARDGDKGHYSIWEWRRNMEDLKKSGFKGSMVQGIARMLVRECPYYDLLDHIRADPNLWVKNQNSEDGMKSLEMQIRQEIEKEIKAQEEERRLQGRDGRAWKKRTTVSLLEGATNDLACIQVLNGMWKDPANPEFKIFKSCSGQVKEIEELEWQDWSEIQRTTRNLREKIKDKDNHSFDDLKYYLMSFHDPAEKSVRPPGWKTGGWFAEQLSRQGYDLGITE